MIDNYVAPRAGCYVSRMGTESLYAAVAKELSHSECYRMLSASDKTSVALRATVAQQVKALGGLNVEWHSKYLIVSDHGEFHHEFHHANRWVLDITVDEKRPSAEEGIKRRKIK